MTETYEFAGRTVQISTVHEALHRLCADYRAQGQPDFCVETRQADIDRERRRQERTERRRQGGGEAAAAAPLRDAYLETLAVYREMAEAFPSFDTLLIHGSAIAADGEAFLFIAKSGTGKSTHTRLWREMLGERCFMINDDKPLVRLDGGGAVVCGTPWDGKHRLSRNVSVPLKAVCILERAEENRIRRIDGREALPMLLQQVYRPASQGAMEKTLTLIERLAERAGLYRLGCNMRPEAAKVSYEGMRGEHNEAEEEFCHA